MIRKILLIASILLFSQICNGQVAGRGLFCVVNEEINGVKINSDIGIIFEETSVKKYDIIRSKDEYSVIKTDNAKQYDLESDYITWIDGTFFWTFNRKDGSLVGTYIARTPTKTHYKCQVTNNESELEELMSELRDNMQEIYDKEREGNVL